MPIPRPEKGEKDQHFISRCMGDSVMLKEYPDQKQRAGVCYTQLRRSRGSESTDSQSSTDQPSANQDEPRCTSCPCASCPEGKTCGGSDCVSCESRDQGACAVQYFAAHSASPEPYASVSVRSYVGLVTEKTIKGDKQLVFPIVLMVEGVRQAATAPYPELLLRAVFQRALKPGLKIPLLYTHPRKGKQFVNAADPHDSGTGVPIGEMSNIRFKGGKMIGIAQMSRKLTEAAGADALMQWDRIKKNRMVEVSLGHRAKIYPLGGKFQGKAFFGVHVYVEIDHLAIMTSTARGACSNADGCGAPRAAEASIPRVSIAEAAQAVVLESSKFSGVFALVDSKPVNLGRHEPRDLRHHDESQFVLLLENHKTRSTKVISQRFRRISEARFLARARLAAERNPDVVAIIARTLGTAEIDGKRRQVFKDVIGMTWRAKKKEAA